MRALLLFSVLPCLALALARVPVSRNAVTTPFRPMVKAFGFKLGALPGVPRAITPAQYSLLSGQRLPGISNYVRGPDGRLAQCNPNAPAYLQTYNSAIPGCSGVAAAGPQPIRYYLPGAEPRPGFPNGGFAPPAIDSAAPGGGAGGSPLQQVMNILKGAGGSGSGASPSSSSSGSSGSSGGNYSPGPLLTGAGLHEGMCMDENRNHDQVTLGYCQAIQDAMKQPCLVEKLEQLARSAAPEGMNRFCNNYDQLKRNPTLHALFWQQLSAALAQEESGWNNETVGGNGNSIGIFQINNNARDYGCTCANVNVSDGHSNASCGPTVILANLLKDGVMGSGEAAKKTSRGIARYFGPFNDNQENKRNRIAQKTNNWCVTRGNSESDSEAPVISNLAPSPLIISSSSSGYN